MLTSDWSQLWSAVFFCLVLFLGVDSQFATVEVILTSIKDGCQSISRWGASVAQLSLSVQLCVLQLQV